MAKKIDWSYHRRGWTSCGYTQEFLAKAEIDTKEEIDARKNRIGDDDALELTKQVSEIYVAKGKKVTHLNLKKDKPDSETLLKLMMGPTGNLRAPTIRVGKKLVVGFNQEIYEKVFG